MTKERLKEELRVKKGYLKSGPNKVSRLFGVSVKMAKLAIREVKEEIRGAVSEVKEKSIKSESTLSRKEALEFTAKALIENGKIQEAIDLLTQVKKEDVIPMYKPSKFKDGNYVVLGCTHLPFHNKKMWKATCKIVEEMQDLAGVILAGDILDMHSISRHGKGKIRLENYTLCREYKEANEALDMLDKAIGDRNISKEFFYGNHEDWFNQWGKDVDSFYLGKSGAVSPYEACFKHRGYNTQFDWKKAFIKLGDLKVIHGEWCAKHAAHKHCSELHENVAFFHTHRMGTYYESDLMGLNCGWGGDKEYKVFSYMSDFQKKNWRNGILLVNLNKGKAYPNVLDFNNGHFFYNNKLY